MDNILIIKTSALGDIVQSLIALEYLVEKFPGAAIDWVVEAPFADLLQAHPAIRQLHLVHTLQWRKKWHQMQVWREMAAFHRQLRSVKYDLVFDLQGNIKSGMILAQVRSQHKIGFGPKSVHEWPNLLFTNRKIEVSRHQNVRMEYLSLVASYFGDQHPKQPVKIALRIPEEQQQAVTRILSDPRLQGGRVLVCPGSAWPNKRLTPETLLAFLQRVHDFLGCSFIFVWGNQAEQEQAQKLQQQFAEHAIVLDKLRLPVLQHLMQQCDLVIAMDSLPLHLAGTSSTPTFSVFGASSAAKYKPLGAQHGAYQGTCPYGRNFERRCPILRSCKTGACIRSLDSEQLFTHFDQWCRERQKILSSCKRSNYDL